MRPASSFRHVVFDLDGTLVATDGFWIPAARAGASRAFEELGLERDLPRSAEWMSVVGLPLDEGLAHILPELSDEQRDHVRARCVEAEHELLRTRGAFLLPGVEETLRELSAQGVRMAVASNCGRDYLEHMLGTLGPLREFISEGRCLDSPGVANKADMIADILLGFGTHDAVMVGDRSGDREAAWANGLPFVYCDFGFGGVEEARHADAVIEQAPELLPVLARRDAWVRGCLEELGGFDADRPSELRVGGGRGTGKAAWAEVARRLLDAAGVPAEGASSADVERVLLGGPGPAREVHLIASEEVRERRLKGRARLPGVTALSGSVDLGPDPIAPEGALVVETDSALGPVRRTRRGGGLSEGAAKA